MNIIPSPPPGMPMLWIIMTLPSVTGRPSASTTMPAIFDVRTGRSANSTPLASAPRVTVTRCASATLAVPG
jgi:hypothetical protein